MASRYLVGWRKCPQCFDEAKRTGLYPPLQKLCKMPVHRQGEFSEAEALTEPLAEDERERLLNRVLGDDLIGAIETTDPDIIRDTVAERLTQISLVRENEIREVPEMVTKEEGGKFYQLEWVEA